MTTFLFKKRKLITATILQRYNARLVRMRKDQVLFEEGNPALEYFQVEEGQVRMYILNDEGHEFTQGIFNAGESFGEPPLLGNFAYPSTAVALTEGKVWRMAKSDFIELLKNNFDIHLKLNHVLCNRLQYKSMILTEISSHSPEHRINTILKYLKSKISPGAAGKIPIPYTRQQLADMTSLRVETVIRTVKRMEKEGKIELDGHTILY
jgi:CRP/FNR family transcriptional regulator, cyclic AMP receptor protein